MRVRRGASTALVAGVITVVALILAAAGYAALVSQRSNESETSSESQSSSSSYTTSTTTSSQTLSGTSTTYVNTTTSTPFIPMNSSSFGLLITSSADSSGTEGGEAVYGNSYAAANQYGQLVLKVNGTQSLIIAAPDFRGKLLDQFAPKAGEVYKFTLDPLVTPKFSSAPNSIGYIGCSITEDSVAGYDTQVSDGKLFWNPTYTTGGGSIDRWVDPNSTYWTSFRQALAAFGQPQAVWINVCVRADAVISFSQLTTVISTLRSYVPNATLLISPHTLYDPPNICFITGGMVGVIASYQLLDQAVQAGLASPGPNIGPLTPSNSNGCDPNRIGEYLLGLQLADYFG